MPSAKELAKALARQDSVTQQPRNRFLGATSDAFKFLSDQADRYVVPERDPLLAGMRGGDLLPFGNVARLLDDLSHGGRITTGRGQTTTLRPEVVDTVALGGMLKNPVKLAGIAALKNAAKQIHTGTGVLGSKVMNPRMNMFAGEGAKTADHGALKVAKDMQAAGVPDEQIHAKTGWTLGFPDRQPRFEIDDNPATIRGVGTVEEVAGRQGANVGDVMWHPSLYDEYPNTRGIPLEFKGKAGGAYGTDMLGNEGIMLGKNLSGKSTLLHELQHSIQRQEGFATGGSPEMFMRGYQNKLKDLNSQVTDINQQMRAVSGTPQYDELMNARSNIVKQIQAIEGREGLGALEAANKDYRRLAGEAEARLTQSRMNMTPAERAASYPPSMFDVPVKDQIVRYGDNVGGAMMQRPKPSGLLDYQIEHKPMTIEGGAAPLHDLAKSFGEDVYGKNALQYYGSGDARESGTLRLLQALRGKPDAQVTIYRGAPSEAGGINAGDWVTLDKRVAQDYVDQALASDGKAGKVFSQKVPASHITSWPDSLMEFGYHPK